MGGLVVVALVVVVVIVGSGVGGAGGGAGAGDGDGAGVGGWRCWVVLVGGLVSIDKCHRCVGSCLTQPVHGDSSHSSLKPDIEGAHQPAVAILILLPTQELATR